MTLEVLSSIKGAESSEAVDKLFDVVKNAAIESGDVDNINSSISNAVSLDALRDDVVIECNKREKTLIKENFPKEKDGFLVVSKVIED